MYATNYFENAMLNLMQGAGNNINAPATMYLALMLSDPGDTGTEGTEITYTGYTRQPIHFSEPAPSGTGMMIQNTAMISFPESSSSAGSVTYIAVYDSLTGGNMWLYAQLDTSLTVQAGVSPVFREGTVKWIWTGNFTTLYKTRIMNTLRGTSCSSFTPYAAFCNGDPTGTGAEFSGNGYARVQLSMTAPEQQASGTAKSVNSADVLSEVATGAWGTLNTVAIYNAASGGQAFAVIGLNTSYNVTNKYAVGFHAGDLQVNVN